jgi:hypothetical protein
MHPSKIKNLIGDFMPGNSPAENHGIDPGTASDHQTKRQVNFETVEISF